MVDGQNHYVYNLNSTSLNSAFVEENAGTIKNLNLQVDFQAKEITNATGTPKMAGVAILNTGLIDNVHVGKYVVSGGVSFESIISIDKISLGVAVEATASRVGGIASRSTGIISNSSVDANIYAVDSVRQGTSAGNAAFAGGIVAELDGTEDKAEIKAKIINSYFAGNITSNIVGGIASAVSGDVEIERCYIKEFVDSEEVDRTILTGTDLNTSEYSIYERIIVGGLVAMTTSGSKVAIYDSYSLATIYIERNENDNNNTSIGGIVAFVHNSTSSLNIDGCYVLINAYSNIDNTGELVTLYGLTPNKPTSTQGVVSGYYIIHEENAISVENGVGEQVTTEQLKTKLDSGVYDIESEGYPTLK